MIQNGRRTSNAKNKCSFCGCTLSEDMPAISSRQDKNVKICFDCVHLYNAYINEMFDMVNDEDFGLDNLQSKLFEDEDKEDKTNLSDKKLSFPKPIEIKNYLDQYVIGQDDAKKILSVAVYNHYKRINALEANKNSKDATELPKNNVLLIGPTGSGKTYLAQTLAKILNVPFAIADATTVTEAGYVGDDVENILVRLLAAADYDVKKAERGIIYIDEIDKIARKSENTSITRDVSGEGVQQALLKIIESTIASVPPNGGRKHPNQQCIYIDTKNILFICGGAFVGIEKFISKRTSNGQLGFRGNVIDKNSKASDKLISQVVPDDLRKFGLIPELIGRLPVVVTLHSLDEDAIVKIMTEPKNATTKQYKELFSYDGVALEFEKEALRLIAKKAFELGVGARGVKSIMEKVLLDFQYTIPSQSDTKNLVITKELVEERLA